MDYMSYGEHRITIVCGKYEGRTKRCVDYLYGELSLQVPYILTVTEADKLTDDIEKNYSIIAVGCPQNNPYIESLCSRGLLNVPADAEGYRIKIFDNPKNSEKQIFALAGGGESGALYAVSEFCMKYLQYVEQNHTHLQKYFTPSFRDKMKEVDFEECPKIRERGIWTWGHVIFDFKRFIDNMVRLKMNTLIMWNDHAPINAKELVEYAHLSGVKLIWGFSFGWGYDYDISDADALRKIIDDSLDNYEKNYAHLGGDGLYFQTFTEIHENTKDGVSVATQAANFVNLARKLATQRFGNIRLQFGLHATSVCHNLDELRCIDNGVEIVWEDCGAFPFAYVAHDADNFEESCELVRNAANLRGSDDNFSVVLKGLCCLDWTMFEHQKGSFVLGEHTARDVSARYKNRKKLWRYQNAYWVKNADKASIMMKTIRDEKDGKTMVTALIEEGMFEEKINFGAAVMGLCMWDCDKDIKEIMCDAALMPNVDF